MAIIFSYIELEDSTYFSLYTFIFILTTHILYIGIRSIGEKKVYVSYNFINKEFKHFVIILRNSSLGDYKSFPAVAHLKAMARWEHS